MGIPIGKLALYCAAGGIAPHRVLPVTLDLGTDNEELLNDEYYIGMQHPRLKGAEYHDAIDEFVTAMRHHFKNVCIQFEDFSSDVAGVILDKYRRNTLCFNDDIQGTGCVTLAGILSALKAQGLSQSALRDQRFLVAGAGSAGLGVANMLVMGMMQQGLTADEARSRFYICDKDGLLGSDRAASLDNTQRMFMRDRGDGELPDGTPLLEVAKHVKPTVLLGLSAVGGLFTEELVRTVNENSHVRPMIFPLSNPTSNAECTAEQAYEWTNGRAIFASGSPFDPVDRPEGTLTPSQCNNMFIFPGLGLGATVGGASKITDRTLYDISIALADSLTQAERDEGRVFPTVGRIREVSEKIAHATLQSSIHQGIATRVPVGVDPLEFLRKKTYDPIYVPLGRDPYQF